MNSHSIWRDRMVWFLNPGQEEQSSGQKEAENDKHISHFQKILIKRNRLRMLVAPSCNRVGVYRAGQWCNEKLWKWWGAFPFLSPVDHLNLTQGVFFFFSLYNSRINSKTVQCFVMNYMNGALYSWYLEESVYVCKYNWFTLVYSRK